MHDVLVCLFCWNVSLFKTFESKYFIHVSPTHACDLVSEICRPLFLEMFMNACSHVDMSLQEYLQKKVWKDKRLCLP